MYYGLDLNEKFEKKKGVLLWRLRGFGRSKILDSKLDVPLQCYLSQTLKQLKILVKNEMKKFINDFTRYYNDRYENGWKVFEKSKPDDRQRSTNYMVGHTESFLGL